MTKKFFLLIFSFLFLIGCASSAQTRGKILRPQAEGETVQDVTSAIEQVLGVVSGKNVDQKELERLGNQIQKDPQAKSAVEVIANSVSGKNQGVRYCPIDGARYSPKLSVCPLHHIPLKILDE